MLVLFIVWSNYQDIQIMRKYQMSRSRKGNDTSNCNIYPWWNHHRPSWNWNINRVGSTRYYFHPTIGWYASPFLT